MHTLSPSADRLGAALRALRETQDGDGIVLGTKCLHAVIAQLAEEGVSQEDLQPLADLEAYLGQLKPQGNTIKSETVPNRRRGSSPSPILIARAAAVIDLLVKGGHDESEAAQMVMRRLMAVGVPPPIRGGDARGWRRLLEFRNELLQGCGPHEAKEEYRAFTREIEAIPAGERVKRVLDERLWDRRRAPR